VALDVIVISPAPDAAVVISTNGVPVAVGDARTQYSHVAPAIGHGAVVAGRDWTKENTKDCTDPAGMLRVQTGLALL